MASGVVSVAAAAAIAGVSVAAAVAVTTGAAEVQTAVVAVAAAAGRALQSAAPALRHGTETAAGVVVAAVLPCMGATLHLSSTPLHQATATSELVASRLSEGRHATGSRGGVGDGAGVLRHSLSCLTQTKQQLVQQAAGFAAM